MDDRVNRRRPTTGPITVTIREGSVVIAERTYMDAPKMRVSVMHSWPRWIEHALSQVERRNAKRAEGAATWASE